MIKIEKKQDVSAYYSYYNTTIEFWVLHIRGMWTICTILLLIKFLLSNGFTYAIRNQSRKYNIIWQK
jgi:hypothetical protein